MSDTPRTDQVFGPSVFGVRSRLCRALERELAAAIQERDNALSDWRQADTDSIRAIHERNEARAQRDQLADALREIASGLHDWKTCVDRIAPKAIAVTSSPLTIKTDEQSRD